MRYWIVALGRTDVEIKSRLPLFPRLLTDLLMLEDLRSHKPTHWLGRAFQLRLAENESRLSERYICCCCCCYYYYYYYYYYMNQFIKWIWRCLNLRYMQSCCRPTTQEMYWPVPLAANRLMPAWLLSSRHQQVPFHAHDGQIQTQRCESASAAIATASFSRRTGNVRHQHYTKMATTTGAVPAGTGCRTTSSRHHVAGMSAAAAVAAAVTSYAC